MKEECEGVEPLTVPPHRVHLGPALHQESLMVVARRRHRLVPLGQQNELSVVKTQQVTRLPDHVGSSESEPSTPQ